jgi:hypothetical protein
VRSIEDRTERHVDVCVSLMYHVLKVLHVLDYMVKDSM